MEPINRRRFLGKAAAASVWVGGVTANAAEAARIHGANDRPMLALVGAGGRGTEVAGMFAARGDNDVAYVCDLHPKRRGATCKSVSARAGGKDPKPLRELNEALAIKELDAVIIATQDHWHALGTIRACQAGKDVYVEKPPSHTVWEGRKMVEAARKYKRVVQVGTQTRSSPYALSAAEYIRSGKLGRIHLVKVFNIKPGSEWHLAPDDACPAGFDWDAWLGPTAVRPHNSALMTGGWHRYWAYCGGDMADDGIHQLDLALQAMGDPGMPSAVYCSGSRFEYKDDQEVPDLQVATYDYPTFRMTFENGGYTPYMDKIAIDVRENDLFPFWPQCATRIEIYGTEGLMYLGRHGGGWQVFGKSKVQSRPGELIAQEYGRQGNRWHQDNFLACIKDRKNPNADIEIGHRAAVTVHMANIAHRAGNRLLKYDASTERFDLPEANKLLRRNDRKAYAVPDIV